MKRCPQCHRTYTDDTLRFCLDDGVLLSASEQTVPIQHSPTSSRDNPQTEVLPARLFNPPPAKPKSSSLPGYVYVIGTLLVVSIFLLFAGVGVFAWLKLRGTETPSVANKRSDGTKERGTPSPGPSLDSLTRQLLGTWSWGSFKETFSADGTGIYYDESKKCFDFKYGVSGGVLHMAAVGGQQCGPSGLDYRISFEGEQLKQEYTGNGYITYWKRER
jgi:hypothetical protein